MSAVVPFNPRDQEERRPLPFNLDVEMALLGAILLNNNVLLRIPYIQPEHFSEDIHKRIFDCASKLIGSGRPATPITLKTFLGDHDLGGSTVSQYLARLAAEATTTVNATGYAETVRDLYLRRESIERCREHMERLYESPADAKIEALIGEFEDDMSALRPHMREQGEFRTFRDVSARSIEVMAKAYQNDGRITGMLTGLNDLDSRLGGLQPGDLIIVGGRPSMGKTAFAQRVALVGAMSLMAPAPQEGQVALLTLEMTDVQLGIRMLCEQADVSPSKVRRNTIDEQDFTLVTDTARRLQDLPLAIDQTPRQTYAQVSGKLRNLHRRRPVKLIVVDYLQLMIGGNTRGYENRMQVVTDITTGFKSLAKELGCPVVALSQLSRQSELTDDKRPQLSHLRESGSIEQDADIVLFCHREAYYIERKKPREGTEAYFDWEREMQRCAGRAEIIIAKNRHGAIGTVEVGFDGAKMRFTDALPEWNEAPGEPDKPKRERKPKPVKLSADATILFGVMKAMSISHVEEPTLRPRMEHPRAKLIAAPRAKEYFGTEMGLKGDDVAIDRAWKAAYKLLRSNEIAYWCEGPAPAKEPYVYLDPDKVK